MGLLLNDPFWLTPEQVDRLTLLEISDWYIKPMQKINDEVKGVSQSAPQSAEEMAASAAMAWGGDAELARKIVREASIKMERDRLFAKLEKEA